MAAWSRWQPLCHLRQESVWKQNELEESGDEMGGERGDGGGGGEGREGSRSQREAGGGRGAQGPGIVA